MFILYAKNNFFLEFHTVCYSVTYVSLYSMLLHMKMRIKLEIFQLTDTLNVSPERQSDGRDDKIHENNWVGSQCPAPSLSIKLGKILFLLTFHWKLEP